MEEQYEEAQITDPDETPPQRGGSKKHLLGFLGVVGVILLGVLLLSGGDDELPSPPQFTQGTQITLLYDNDGQGTQPTYSERVRCPQKKRLCERVLRVSEKFRSPPSKQRACTQVYGGPQTAAVRGVIKGERINLRLTREDGCAIQWFDEWADVLQAAFPQQFNE